MTGVTAQAAISAALLALTLLPAGQAAAHDHRAPRAELRVAGQRQSGRLWSSAWYAAVGEVCVGNAVEARPTYRSDAVEVGEGRFRARVRFVKGEAPARVVVSARQRLGEDGVAVGRRVEVHARIRPLLAPDGSSRAWTLLIRSSVREDLYLLITGRWPDVDGCGPRQHASWTFHLSAD